MVVEHLDHPSKAFAEVARCRRPSRALVINTPNLLNYVMGKEVASGVLPEKCPSVGSDSIKAIFVPSREITGEVLTTPPGTVETLYANRNNGWSPHRAVVVLLLDH
jgi:hypothetical protein